MYKIKQGEDVVLELPVLDDDNNKVVLTTATKIRVALYVKNALVYPYLDSSLEVGIAGYGDVSINATNNYQLDISFTRAQNSDAPLGDLVATVLLEFPDATLTDRRYEYSYNIGVIEKGILRNEDLTV